MSKKMLFLSGLLFLTLILSLVSTPEFSFPHIAKAAPAAAEWFDHGWNFRRAAAVTCSCSQAVTDYQVQILLDSTNFTFTEARSDGGDLRVTASDGISPVPFWIESWSQSLQQASIWVKMPLIPLGGTQVFLYYGNANPASNLVETPPIGPWTRATGNPITPAGHANASLLAENIVYDSATSHYWMTLANYTSGYISLVWSDDPTNAGAWNWEKDVLHPTNMQSGAPHLIHYNGTWYLFYADWPNIRVATSSTVNGSYTVNLTNILSPSEPWEIWRVDEPYVFQRNDGKWVLVYMGDARTANLPTEQIGYATADSITGPYTKYAGNPVLAFGPVGSYDHGTIADPWVVEFHGIYYIGYTVSPTENSPWYTAIATTTDWLTFTKQGVILPLASSGWDSNNSFRGAVTRVGDTYVFSYTGDSYQMGIATQPVYKPVNQEADVFPFFDEFNGTTLDTSKWVTPPDNGALSQLSFSGTYLRLTATSDALFIKIHGNTSFGMDYLVEGYARDIQGGTSQKIPEIGLVNGSGFSNAVRLVADFHAPFTNWEYQQDGASWTDMGIAADTTWHRLRVYRLSAGVAGFQIDSLPAQTATTPVNALNPFLMSYGAGNQFDVDWIRVRKYCGADAVAVVSTTEEQRPLYPHITILKTGPASALSGSTIDFTITVTNDGDYALANVSVADVLTPACVRSGLSLAINEILSYSCSASNVTQDLLNSATASGTGNGSQVSSTAIFYVDILHPSITIDKGPATQIVVSGNPAIFTITVTNTGDVVLQSVTVTDTLVPGCGRSIGTLSAGQSSSYTCSLLNVTSSFVNTSSVTSQGPLGSTPGATSGTATVTVRTLTEAPWMDANWSYRRPFQVSCPCGRLVTDYQVKVILNSSNFDFNNALSDGSDLRVTDLDGTTQIPFWIESWSKTGQEASIWVKLPQLPPSGTFIYLYYGNPNPPGPVTHEMPPVGPWTRAAGNPILPANATGTSLLAEDIVYDPATVRYWMTLANYSQNMISLVSSTDPTNPAAWNWEGNVIQPSNFASGAPHLIQYNGTWYLFYADWPNIRVATSATVNGPYSVYPDIILTTSSLTWESWRVDEPYVFLRGDGKWVLVYMADARTGGAPTEQVGFATADSITGPYTKSSLNPVLAFGPSGTFDAGTIADPWVYKYHDTYYIGYTVSPTSNSPWQTAYATTTDWVTFTKHGITLPLAASGWDSVNAFRGAVIRIGDTYVFSYTGDGYQMGIATQPVYMQDPFNTPEIVFPFYDNFNDSSFDTSKWVIESGGIGQLSETGGILTLTSTGQSAGQFSKIDGQSSIGMDYMVEAYARHPQAGTQDLISEFGLMGNGFAGDKVRIADDFLVNTIPNHTYWQRQAMLSSTPNDPWVLMNQPSDTNWHTFRVYRISPNMAGFQIDSTTPETTTTTVPTSNLPPFLMSFGAGNTFEVDWIRVRKWCGSEPDTILGAQQANPTAVTLATFTSESSLSTVRLDWATANEVGLVGFNVWRSESLDGSRQKQNTSLLPASHAGQMIGAAYEFSDVVSPGKRYYYWLELVQIDGSVLSGPLTQATDYLALLPVVIR